MAVVSQGWKLVVNWVDTGGNVATKTYDLTATDTAGDATDVFTQAGVVLAVLIAATDAAMKSYNVTKVLVEDALVLPAAAEVENNAQITAKIAGIPNKSAVIEVPAPKISCFNAPSGAGYNQCKFIAPSPLVPLVELYTPTNELYVSDGENITTVDIKGKRVHHKSNRG